MVDHVRGEVVWAHPGKNADTLKAFFDELGPERAAKLEAVTIDMSAAYIKAVTEASPGAQIIFDRFHVQRLAHDALDQVRRAEVRAADTDDKRDMKGTRWALHKNPWNLSRLEHESCRCYSEPTGASTAAICSRRRSPRASTAARFTSPPPSSASGSPGRRAADSLPS